MAKQTIFRSKQTSNYTVLSNNLINAVERGLDLGASALLGYLLSKPQDWIINTESLARQLNKSLAKIRQLLRYLREAGYVIMDRLSSGCVDWYVYDTPQSVVVKAEDNTVEEPAEIVVEIKLPTEIIAETNTKAELDAVQPPEKVVSEKLVFADIFANRQQEQVKTIIADAPLDLQPSILSVLTTNLKKGGIKLPMAYLKALVSRANAGTFEIPPPPIKPILSVSHIPFSEQVDEGPTMTNLEHFSDLYQRYGEKAVPKAYLDEVLANLPKKSE